MDLPDETPPDLAAILNDPERLAALARTGLPDSGPEPSFDRLTRLASRLLGAPVSLVSLVDAERQFFKSCLGLPRPWADRRETPLSHSFCQHVVASGRPLVIADARIDPRFRDNLAIPDLGVVAYLGIPLLVDGQVIGSFCAIDGRPRPWGDDEVETLAELAESVVTEIRLRVEVAALEASRGQYRALFDSIDEGFCVFEMIRDAAGRPVDYRFVEVNPAFEAQSGLRDAVGRSARELVPDLEEFWFETYGRVEATGEDVRVEHEAVAMERRIFHVHAFRIGKPGAYRVAALFANITERRNAEREREELVEQLIEADRRKDEFLAMLAHELRNPLGAISGGVQLVRAVRRPEEFDQIQEMIDRQARQLTHLIDDLLDVSRIATGKIVLKPRTVELGDIVARAIDQVRPLIADKQHRLDVDIPAGPIHFVADPTRAEQVLANLLTNAAKYTPSGGRVGIAARREADAVVVAVTDNGVGIPAEMLPKVFGLFTQLDSSIERSEGGLGIGLTLVRTLVEMHGGTVAAQSGGPGQGSAFTVTLPIGEPEAAVESPQVPLPIASAHAPLRILIIDDNRDTARMTARLLAHRGHLLQAAYDGHEGVEAARRFRPDVILLDIGLPGMNGYEVATLLGQDDCCRETVVVAVSGYGEPAAREKSRRAGFHHHLTKPLDFDQLNAILHAVAARDAAQGPCGEGP